MNISIKNSIIYNVYPTSLYDSNGDGVGDLNGITQKLEYIKQFADIVWVNPVFVSPFRDGGYDVADYYDIDKRFGCIEDVWTDCKYKNISGNSERDANYLINFFCFQPALNFGFSKKTLSWQHHYLDEACCKVHEEVIRIIKYWLSIGIDGFRVDMAESIVKDDVEGKSSCEIWRKIFRRVREEFRESFSGRKNNECIS